MRVPILAAPCGRGTDCESVSVIPWSLLDKARVPGESSELRLMQRGGEFAIMLGSIPLMNSRMSGSEVALATLSCGKIRSCPGPSLLIGGLGMGFTLRAALACLGADAAVVVAELVPAVVAWARGPMAEIFGDSLTDPRVAIREADVAELIAAAPGAYDAILLDVDNGPDGLTRTANDRLYHAAGLSAGYAALRPGGLLAVWSSGPDRSFTKRLRQTGFAVEEVSVRSGGARHMIWFATRPRRG